MASAIQYQPKRTSMSHWGPEDPANMMYDSTDHWTKMKVRALKIDLKPTYGGNAPAFSNSQDYLNSLKRSYNTLEREPQQFHPAVKSTQTRLPGLDFNTAIVSSLNGNVPGSYHLSRPRTRPSRETLRTSYNTKAKEGFNYWEISRPKPTTFGRYGLGSYKTVLGIGNAPRT